MFFSIKYFFLYIEVDLIIYVVLSTAKIVKNTKFMENCGVIQSTQLVIITTLSSFCNEIF